MDLCKLEWPVASILIIILEAMSNVLLAWILDMFSVLSIYLFIYFY